MKQKPEIQEQATEAMTEQEPQQDKTPVAKSAVDLTESIPIRAKKIFQKMPKRTIQVSSLPNVDQNNQHPLLIVVNGVELRIPRGVPVKVPEPFAQAWENSSQNH